MDAGQDQEEESDPAQLWPALGLSERAESAPLPVFSHLPQLRLWALPTLQPHLGAAQAPVVGEGSRDPLHPLSPTCLVHNSGAWGPQST